VARPLLSPQGKIYHTTINQMANTTTKNILLSQPKIGQNEAIPTVALAYTVVNKEKTIEVKAEVPGIDPSTIEVGFKEHTIHVSCAKGELSIPVSPTVDTSKIKADIVWGMLTLVIPLPEPPASGKIKVSIHDSAPVKGKPQPSAQPSAQESHQAKPQVKRED
jgi:HSP20 family molecular chaperone IbpA